MEIVDEYKYLGIVLGRSGSNIAAKNHIVEQANEALLVYYNKNKKSLITTGHQKRSF